MGPENQEIMNIEVFGLSHTEIEKLQIEKLLIQNGVEYFNGAFWLVV